MSDEALREQIAWSCRILAHDGQGDYTLGHASARGEDGETVLMKRYGIGLEEVTPADVLRIDLEGNLLEGDGRVHLEYVLHTEIYRVRPDVHSVIHTHPPYTTAFGATDARLEMLNHDAVLFRDGLASFDGTAELIQTAKQGEQVAAALGDHLAILLRGHGVVVTGKSVPWSTYTALTLERVLRIQSLARSFGNLMPMSSDMANRVYPDKYRDGHVASYWDYLIRGLQRAGLAGGMPEHALVGSNS
jgi:L-fuculose-phosphate aldolase